MAPMLLGLPGRPPSGRPRELARGLLRLQLQRRRVDAVALAGGVGTVVEDVAKVPAAPLADDLGALHEEAVVRAQLDVLEVLGLVEAGPARTGLELGLAVEQLRATSCAGIGPIAVLVDVFAGEGPLGALLTKDVVLLGRQLRLPLLFGLFDLLLCAHLVLTWPVGGRGEGLAAAFILPQA